MQKNDKLGSTDACGAASQAERATPMDIGAWLRSLGVERYEQAFRDNEIDEQVLPKLTADDLTGLGIVLIGHRRKLLESIADLRARMESAKSDGAAPQTLKSVATPTPTIGDAQRRQLTVMFCDLVGSTALASRFDPEEVRDVLHSYHAVVSEEVSRLDGFVAKFMGDGVWAYFGYPQAHEDDDERAIRTGLSLPERVRRLQRGSAT